MVIIDNLAHDQQLLVMPGLKALKITKRGRNHLWSPRINAQWSIIFDWDKDAQSAYNVQVIDCH